MILELGLCDAWIIDVFTVIILLLLSSCMVLTLGQRLIIFYKVCKYQSLGTDVRIYKIYETCLVVALCMRVI